MKQNQKKRFNNGRFNNRNARQMITRNTVLESSGPCGKLRGTALQLFEKYQIAAKDAMMQSDIVLAQTCMQYADHYIRLQNQAIQNEQQMRGNNNQQQNIQNVMTKEDAVEEVKDKYLNNGMLNPKALTPNPSILKYQVPGGMLSNLMSQLQAQNAMDKYEDVLREVPKVRKDLGYPPLVTPLSQMVGTQAVMNVITGERYKLSPKEVKDYLLGNYGQAPAEINPEVRAKIVGDAECITHRPADDIAPEFASMKEKYAQIVKCDEDVLTCALFEAKAVKFLTQRDKKETDEVIEVNLYIG